MRRFLKIVAVLLGLLVFAGFVAWRIFVGPDPAEILASIERPPSPVLAPSDAQAAFRTAPGFRVELVAAEPLIVDPVAMDWDDEGRLYVVEMRGYMRDLDGGGEDQPSGRVVRLEDLDGDGRMDRSDVFLDGLVLPRAIAVLPEGVLIGASPDLLLCTDRNEDGRCGEDERRVLARYAAEGGNVEHQENGLLPALDGWLYNAKSTRRFRLRGDRFEEETTIFRGQWGLAQDDEGRLYYNHNSGFAYVDLFPGEAVLRQAATATASERPGLNVSLGDGEKVWGVRVAPGLNRAYLSGTLRVDGRQAGPTGVSGLVVQRGDQYGADYRGDVFVPESGGAAMSRFRVAVDGLEATGEHVLSADPDWDQREFLASTDERFRPVDVKVGPDGAIWVIDMHRGIIQHAEYVSDHLREYIRANGLEAPGATGRLWRIVREDRPIAYTPPALATETDWLAGLRHPNGWVRDRAQRRLVAAPTLTPGALEALAAIDDFEATPRLHALEVLAQRGALGEDVLARAAGHPDASTRRAALRLAVGRGGPGATSMTRTLADAALGDDDPGTRLQALLALGDLPGGQRPVDTLLEALRGGSPVERQAALSGLGGFEPVAIEAELARPAPDEEALRSLGLASWLAGQSAGRPAQAARRFLDTVASAKGAKPQAARALVEGARSAEDRPGNRRVVLEAAHPLFEADPDEELGEALSLLRANVTWPGDESPGGARPLTPEERARRERGADLFASTCATCHGESGQGNAGLAPPLAGSSWVRDADDWVVRIVLQGASGPIRVRGETWNLVMPGHAHDPRFDDEALAGLLTHLRRSWGHAEDPISPATVARIRAETADHPGSWTADELLALDVPHRLDRFVGTYRVPIVGLDLEIGRTVEGLTAGRDQGPRAQLAELGRGFFSGEGLRIRFDLDAEGPAASARVWYSGQSFPVSRVDAD